MTSFRNLSGQYSGRELNDNKKSEREYQVWFASMNEDSRYTVAIIKVGFMSCHQNAEEGEFCFDKSVLCPAEGGGNWKKHISHACDMSLHL